MLKNQITSLLKTVPAAETAVIFNGYRGPRLLGTIIGTDIGIREAQLQADACLAAHGLTATYISRAIIAERLCVLAHG